MLEVRIVQALYSQFLKLIPINNLYLAYEDKIWADFLNVKSGICFTLLIYSAI